MDKENQPITSGIKHWGLGGYANFLHRIKFGVTGQESSPQSPTISYRRPLLPIGAKKIIGQMTDLGIDIINAWKEASKDLGLEIQTPFTFQLSNKETIECILLVKNFGSEFGTLVFTDSSWTNNNGLKSSGYGISTLGDSYRKYNRSAFIDMLNDWGYNGEIKLKPSWYTGQPWGN